MEESKKPQATLTLTKSSVRNLDQMLEVASKQGGIISSTDLTLPKIYLGEAQDINSLVLGGYAQNVLALFICALKDFWRHCDTLFNSDNIAEASQIVINKYKYWRPEEFILVLKNGMDGKYGKVYGRVSTMTILDWCKQYDLGERDEYFSAKKNQGVDWRDMNPELFKGINLTENRPEVKPDKKYNERNVMFQNWMKEFDKIREGRFAKVDDRHLDIGEFLEYKYNQFLNPTNE